MNKLIFVIVLMASFNVFSTEGAYEINQACVASGCFPGDTAGFPVILTEEGYYKLTSDLTLSENSQGGISIQADNIIIDLQGHAIKGVNECTGVYQDCLHLANEGSGIGIGLNTITNSTVKNGSIIGTGTIGIHLGNNCQIENINTQHVVRAGITVGSGCVISNSKSSYISDLGIQTGASVIKDSSVSHIGQYALAIGNSIIRNVMVFNNTGTGVYDWYGSSIVNSKIYSNGLGIWSANGGTSINDSIINNNVGVGVHHLNGSAFDALSVPLTIKGNTINLNNGGSDNAQFGGAGSIIELGTNFCGRDIGSMKIEESILTSFHLLIGRS